MYSALTRGYTHICLRIECAVAFADDSDGCSCDAHLVRLERRSASGLRTQHHINYIELCCCGGGDATHVKCSNSHATRAHANENLFGTRHLKFDRKTMRERAGDLLVALVRVSPCPVLREVYARMH